jgi:crossover junction endodeoxyribonuclease RuvC
MLIIGIDPGSRITGFGIIKIIKNKCCYVASGCIRVKETSTEKRLSEIYRGIQEVISVYQPDCAAIEQIFMFNNPGAALKLGQARGVALVALSEMNLTVAEYSAKQVKQSVVGTGGATKFQVQHMVQTILELSAKPQEDAADALAIAICHHHTSQSIAQIKGASKVVRKRLRR